MTTTPTPLIALLTDFGMADGYVGVMKGVILGIAPGTALVDLTHEISPQDVRSAAWVLHTSWRSFPLGAIFLCVVDPGVGSARRPIALQAGGYVFVGPDNGLFSYIVDARPDARAIALDNSRYLPPDPSATFHGRDLFAPAAARLATGIPVEELGRPLATESLVRLALPQPTWQGKTLSAHCTHIDRFGNILTDVGGALAQAVFAAPSASLTLAGHEVTARARAFSEGPADALFLYLDSSGYLAIARRDGSAQATLALSTGQLYDAALAIEGIDGIASVSAE